MGGTDGFWNMGQDLLDKEEPEGQELSLSSGESNDEAPVSLSTSSTVQRSGIGSPGVVVAVVFVGLLLLSSVVAFLLWNVSDENPNDLDGDGINNEMDD